MDDILAMQQAHLLANPFSAKILEIVKYNANEKAQRKLKQFQNRIAQRNSLPWYLRIFTKRPYPPRRYTTRDELYPKIPLPNNQVLQLVEELVAAQLLHEHWVGDCVDIMIGVYPRNTRPYVDEFYSD